MKIKAKYGESRTSDCNIRHAAAEFEIELKPGQCIESAYEAAWAAVKHQVEQQLNPKPAEPEPPKQSSERGGGEALWAYLQRLGATDATIKPVINHMPDWQYSPLWDAIGNLAREIHCAAHGGRQ